MPVELEIKYDPPDLIDRMARYPKQLDKEMKQGADAALYIIWDSVPAYPPEGIQPMGVDVSGRKGILGKSLGVSEWGAKLGENPQIFKVRRLGAGRYEARFGTKLKYAARVIGEKTQKKPWVQYWWHMGEVLEYAKPKINKHFKTVADAMAKFLDGK